MPYQLIKFFKNCINETVKYILKLNYGPRLYMLSTNWARVRWGITPLAPCTNISNYWSASHSYASNIRNYMSYANYAATNQIHFSCKFIDVKIKYLILSSMVWEGKLSW